MKVTLLPVEFMAAIQAATNRYITSAMGKWAGYCGKKQTAVERMEENIIGAMGEIAVAKAFNKWFVPKLNTFHKEADFFTDIEVRSTDTPTNSLIIRDNDNLSSRFILVLVTDMTCKLVGWCYGYEREALGVLRNPNEKSPAYFVPQSQLHDMQSFVMDF